jgi:eukaryotic-like serine/threonine-protein kinase
VSLGSSGALAPGESFEDHLIQRWVGSGASAAVYCAWHCPSATYRALKIAHPGTAAGEPDLPGDLLHPDIVRTFASGRKDGRAWQSLEWVPGYDLSRYTQPQWLLPLPLTLATVARLSRALAHAHRCGLTHRDIKPGNVRIHLPARVVKLADFGTARVADAAATRTGLLLGTPAYMAPEMLAGASANTATDLYALAVVLYELISGRRPHEAATMGALLQAVSRDPARRLIEVVPEVPVELDALMWLALHRQPGQRPRDGEAFANELDDICKGLPAPP